MNTEEAINKYLSCDIPRSAAFKEGLAAGFVGMRERIHVPCPYECGTAECDAFFGGRIEGMNLYEQIRLEMGRY